MAVTVGQGLGPAGDEDVQHLLGVNRLDDLGGEFGVRQCVCGRRPQLVEY